MTFSAFLFVVCISLTSLYCSHMSWSWERTEPTLMLIRGKQPSSAVERSRHPSNVISAVCLSNLSYSLINVSTVATTAVFLNARLNLFMKWGAWMCGQALSSERLLLLIISQRASRSLCLSLSVGDMITTAPHQSHGAVICPTFNINMRGCHGGGWQGCLLVPTFLSYYHQLHQAAHSYTTLCCPQQSCTTLTYYLSYVNQTLTVQHFFSSWVSCWFWYYLNTRERLFTANMNWADSITCFHSLGFVHTNPDTVKYVFYVSHCFFSSTSAFCFRAMPNNWKTAKSPTSNSIWYKHGTLLALATQQDEALFCLLLCSLWSLRFYNPANQTIQVLSIIPERSVNDDYISYKQAQVFPSPVGVLIHDREAPRSVWVISINNDLSCIFPLLCMVTRQAAFNGKLRCLQCEFSELTCTRWRQTPAKRKNTGTSASTSNLSVTAPHKPTFLID